MKILIVNSYYYPEVIGGAELSVKKLAEELVNFGHDVYVLCTSQNCDTQEILNGVKVYRFKPCNFGRREDLQHVDFMNFNRVKRKFYADYLYKRRLIYFIDLYNLFNWKKINGLIKTIDPDVVHTNGLYEITPVVWSIAKKNKKPIVHTLRDFYLLCIYGNLKRNGSIACDKANKRCQLRRKINKFMLRNVNIFTSPSNSTKAIFSECRMNIDARTYVISNAIDFDKKELLEQYYKRMNNNVSNYLKIVFIGTLSDFKGINFLIEEWGKIKSNNVELHIAGKGSLKEKVISFCKEYSNAFYEGFLEENELIELLKNCDVLVCPSLWNEPFGRIVLDAYKQVMPVISTGYGGLGEIIDDRETGFILDLKSENPLLEAIRYYMNKDRYSYSLKKIVDKIQQYSINEQARRFQKIYMSVKNNDNRKK